MARVKYVSKICTVCGNEYTGIKTSLYCTKECKNKVLLDRWKEKHPRKQLVRNCRLCGKEFIALSGNQQTCSTECRKELYTLDWKKSFMKRMCIPEKRERRKELSRINYENNKEERLERQHDRILDEKRALAQTLQTGPVIETNNGNIRQDYIETLKLKRLSEKGCLCLKCGGVFNLICAGRSGKPYLDRRALTGKSPCPFCGDAPTGVGTRYSAYQYDVQKIFPNFTEMNYRPDWMDGMEIDLYDPVAKVGLEFHGIKYHSTAVMEESKASRVHREKADKCDANGVQLIQLYETEWVQKRDIVIDKLNAIFHKDMKRMYARKLKVMELNGKSERMEVSKFLDKNHIQGSAGSQWAVGLVDGYELVAVCTFKYGTGYAIGGQTENTEKYWELNRYATKLGYSIVGGLSRCIKRFFDTHVDVDRIVSFADRRWTSPLRTAYGSSGFEAVCYCDTNYQYTDLNAEHPLKNKQYMRKSNIEKRGEPCYSPEKTETEMSKELGFYKVYDAGKIRYEMSRP